MRRIPAALLRITAIVCTGFLIPGEPVAFGQADSSPQPANAPQEALLNPDALDSIVAPLALYPDELLAQTLAASTYPLEIVEADRWVKKNTALKGSALVQAAAKQDWEPCIQALVMFPSVLDQMDGNLKWTTALGNAFLAQQEDVMLAVQRLRQKAEAAGTLASNAQQTVESQQADGTGAIVIQPADPEVVYVPTYDPEAVFGAAVVPYPAIVYPTGIIAASAISFAAGVAVGAILAGWGGSGWGWGVSWGRRPSLYVNNTFINHYGFHGAAYAGHTGNGAWVHNPQYRGAVPYASASVANRYGAAAGIRTPNGAAAGIRTPNGSAGAVVGPNGGAAARVSIHPEDQPEPYPRRTAARPASQLPEGRQ